MHLTQTMSCSLSSDVGENCAKEVVQEKEPMPLNRGGSKLLTVPRNAERTNRSVLKEVQL